MTLADLVETGDIGYAQMERLSAFLDLGRLGRAREVYPPLVYRRRLKEARDLGLATNDAQDTGIDVELSTLIEPARAVWDS